MWSLLRPLIVLALAVASLMILFVGLIAPLTPSEGAPRISDYIIYLGGPMSLPLIGYVISSKDKEKLFI
jgi:hypothetical protein